MAGPTRSRRRHARRTSWLALVRDGVLPGRRSRRRRGAPTGWAERGSALVEASVSRSWSRG